MYNVAIIVYYKMFNSSNNEVDLEYSTILLEYSNI